ncbi:MAG: GbsR/MarR family transcriptional regulator [Anaerolineales bacterium]
MTEKLPQLKQEFIEGMSQISKFWGFPKGMGAVFAVLYLSPAPLPLDEIASQTGLTKGAISTNVRALARMGLVHPSTKLGDRKDYYEAETDFYTSIRAILKERQNSEFDRAVASVRETLSKLEAGQVSGDEAERQFLIERLRALQSFFDALDGLVNAVVRLEGLGLTTIEKVLSILK